MRREGLTGWRWVAEEWVAILAEETSGMWLGEGCAIPPIFVLDLQSWMWATGHWHSPKFKKGRGHFSTYIEIVIDQV